MDRPRCTRTLSCVLLVCLVSSAGGEETPGGAPYVSYSFVETHKTESDHRKIVTRKFLVDGEAGYGREEDIEGSLEPTGISISFFNNYERKLSVQEQARLVHTLHDSKVFELITEKDDVNASYYSHLEVRIAERKAEYSFYSPPLSQTRKAIHGIMLQCAKKLAIDQPRDLERATTVTEGDRELATNVNLKDLLTNPIQYHGKRVAVVGYYYAFFPERSLYIDESARRSHSYQQSLWISSPSSFADASALHETTQGWLRVEGIYLHGRTGHAMLWPGAIVRTTRIEPVTSPSQ